MPPSRIAFALGDLLAEVRRLLPRDEIAGVRVVLKGHAYVRVCRELAEYSGKPIVGDMPGSMVWGGVTIEREPDAGVPGAPETEETYG